MVTSKVEQEMLLVQEVQLLMAEKRTALSVLRTGVGISALPLGIFSVLIATSGNYKFTGVLHLIIPVILACLALFVFSGYLAVRAMRKILLVEDRIRKMKHRSSAIENLLD